VLAVKQETETCASTEITVKYKGRDYPIVPAKGETIQAAIDRCIVDEHDEIDIIDWNHTVVYYRKPHLDMMKTIPILASTPADKYLGKILRIKHSIKKVNLFHSSSSMDVDNSNPSSVSSSASNSRRASLNEDTMKQEESSSSSAASVPAMATPSPSPSSHPDFYFHQTQAANSNNFSNTQSGNNNTAGHNNRISISTGNVDKVMVLPCNSDY
jgi:hypothetical protein